MRVYDALGEKAEQLVPGYRYLISYKDLYTVYGGQRDWFHLMRGAFTFTTEIFTNYLLFNDETRRRRERFPAQQFMFDKYLLFEDAFVPWHDYEHPQFGSIQIGGFKKNFGRINPGFMLEQDAHRVMAFSLFHAYHTPQLEIVETERKPLGGGLYEVTATIVNTRLLPTHSGVNLKFGIDRPNMISLSGAEVLAGMLVHNRDLGVVSEQKINPSQIEVGNISGMATVTVRWIVKEARNMVITIDSVKAGVQQKSLAEMK